jgi:hypothetical protein
MTYEEIVVRRRALTIQGYNTLSDLGFDGPWVTPYQMTSRAPDGPVLVAYHWLDAPSVAEYRDVLARLGYLPHMPFNKVIEAALRLSGTRRDQLYVTQAFHLLPATRSASVATRDTDISFDAVTRHELPGRRVIALGRAASDACRRHGINHVAARHPSARGCSRVDKAKELAGLIVGR